MQVSKCKTTNKPHDYRIITEHIGGEYGISASIDFSCRDCGNKACFIEQEK